MFAKDALQSYLFLTHITRQLFWNRREFVTKHPLYRNQTQLDLR